jgi:hypothetical protein
MCHVQDELYDEANDLENGLGDARLESPPPKPAHHPVVDDTYVYNARWCAQVGARSPPSASPLSFGVLSEGSSLSPGKRLHHQRSSSSHDASPHPQGERPSAVAGRKFSDIGLNSAFLDGGMLHRIYAVYHALWGTRCGRTAHTEMKSRASPEYHRLKRQGSHYCV